MGTAQTNQSPRFVRRTRLAADEYHKNFFKLDGETINALTSPEADSVTPLMSKIYLRMVGAPARYWEREGVLRFTAEERGGKLVGAWLVMCETLGVAGATASKALAWMREQGIVGYFAGKNGVGVRVFLNRAASSIGTRPRQAGQKILSFHRASNDAPRTSSGEAAFNDSFAVLESLDTEVNSRAPKNGADEPRLVNTSPDPPPVLTTTTRPTARREVATRAAPDSFPLEQIAERLRTELGPALESAAQRAAAREHERTREWLETRGLPKAARVAQHEAYNVLRRYGLVKESARGGAARAEVGRAEYVPDAAQRLSAEEVSDLAEACVGMLEHQGQSLERTLSEMCVAAGGFLLPEDVPRVREEARSILGRRGGG